MSAAATGRKIEDRPSRVNRRLIVQDWRRCPTNVSNAAIVAGSGKKSDEGEPEGGGRRGEEGGRIRDRRTERGMRRGLSGVPRLRRIRGNETTTTVGRTDGFGGDPAK